LRRRCYSSSISTPITRPASSKRIVK
jgi:hypothetical protein